MSKSKLGVRAAFAELPFLGEYANEPEVQSVMVERVDPDLLQRTPNMVERIWFVSKEGQKLSPLPVGYYPNEKPWWMPRLVFKWICVPNCRDWYETIGDALKKLPQQDANRVFYILCITGDFIWIYKPPKNFTLVKWIEQQVEAERAELRDKLSRFVEGPPDSPTTT